MREEILGFLQENVVEYKKETSLSELSTVRIGGKAAVIAYPDNIEKLITLVRFLRKNKIRYKILGRMSNILPRDEGYNGVIVRTDRMQTVLFKDKSVSVDAGISLPRLSRLCAAQGLCGLEELSGIPGSLGGAIYGNAGAYGREIADLVQSVVLFDPDSDEIFQLSGKEMCFGYRTSALKSKDLVFLSATLKLETSDENTVSSAVQTFAEKRRESQPVYLPSLGSAFKRPANDILPWKLIDEAGLRGFRIGYAQISEKHAGFIVNTGNATCSDYLSVVMHVEKCVFEKHKITLEREFEIL